jgi:hypothetical protein
LKFITMIIYFILNLKSYCFGCIVEHVQWREKEQRKDTE